MGGGAGRVGGAARGGDAGQAGWRRQRDISFAAEGASPVDGGVRVTGSLTVRGNTCPASFDATVSSDGDEVWLDGELQVNRADFGLTWNWLGIASMHSTIAVHAVFTRQ